MEEYTRTLNKFYREITLGWEHTDEVMKLLKSSYTDDFDKAVEMLDFRIDEVLKPILDKMDPEEIAYLQRCINDDFYKGKNNIMNATYYEPGLIYSTTFVESRLAKYVEHYERQEVSEKEIIREVPEAEKGFFAKLFRGMFKKREKAPAEKKESTKVAESASEEAVTENVANAARAEAAAIKEIEALAAEESAKSNKEEETL